MSKEFNKPGLPKPMEAQVSVVEKSAEISAGPIKVVATAKGFFNGNRVNEGDVFTIPNEKSLGKWMKKI